MRIAVFLRKIKRVIFRNNIVYFKARYVDLKRIPRDSFNRFFITIVVCHFGKIIESLVFTWYTINFFVINYHNTQCFKDRYRLLFYKYDRLFITFNGMSRYYHRRLSWAPFFYLLQRKAGGFQSQTRLFFTSLMLYASFLVFNISAFCNVIFNVNSFFLLLHYASRLHQIISRYYYCCILISVAAATVHVAYVRYLCLYLFYIRYYIKSSISQKENHLSLRKSVKWRFTLKFVFRQIQEGRLLVCIICV